MEFSARPVVETLLSANVLPIVAALVAALVVQAYKAAFGTVKGEKVVQKRVAAVVAAVLSSAGALYLAGKSIDVGQLASLGLLTWMAATGVNTLKSGWKA